MENAKKPQEKESLKNYARYSGLVFQMIATIVIGAWIGVKLDAFFEVKNRLFTIFFLIFSVIASMYIVIKGLLKK